MSRPGEAIRKPEAKFPTYREVVRWLGDYCSEDTRDSVLGSWGGDRDRWAAQDVARMALAITRREDALEMRGTATRGERVALRAIRRQLEVE